MTISPAEASELLAKSTPSMQAPNAQGQASSISPEEARQLLSQSSQAPTAQQADTSLTDKIGGVASSLGRGALQDFLNISTGAGNILSKLDFSPTFKAKLKAKYPSVLTAPGGRGASADFGRTTAALESNLSPTVKAYLATHHSKAPDVSSGAKSKLAEKVGEFLDPALWLGAPEVKAAKGLGVLGRLAVGALRHAAPAGAAAGFEQAGRTGEVKAAPFLYGGAAGASLSGLSKVVLSAGKKVPTMLGSLLKEKIGKRLQEILANLKGGSDASNVAKDIGGNLAQEYKERSGNIDPEEFIYRKPSESVGAAYDRFHTLSSEHKLRQPVNMPMLRRGELPEDADLPLYDKTKVTSHLNKVLDPLKEEIDNKSATIQERKTFRLLSPFKNKQLADFADASDMKRAINDQISSLPIGDPAIARLSSLKSSVRESMVDTAKGNPALKDTLLDADARYKSQVVPFKKISGTKTRTPFWNWYAHGKGEPSDILRHYVRGGAQADKVGKLNELLKLMPNDGGTTRRKVAYWWLKETEENPKKMIEKWNSLGIAQKRELLPEFHDELEELSRLKDNAPSAFEENVRHPMTLNTFPFDIARHAARTGAQVLTGYGSKRFAENPLEANRLIEQIVGKKPMRFAAPLAELLRRAAPASGMATSRIGGGG